MSEASREARNRFITFAATLGILAAVLMGGSLLAGQAKQDDFAGGKVLHEACTVTNKNRVPSRYGADYVRYEVTTTCGGFITGSNLFEVISQDETYDLIATGGNWANKPTIVSVESSNQ